MYPATRHDGAGPCTIRNLRSAFGSRIASWTLTRWAVLCVVAANVRERVVGRVARAERELDGVVYAYPPDGGVAVLLDGAGEPTVSVVVVAGCGGRGAGAGRV